MTGQTEAPGHAVSRGCFAGNALRGGSPWLFSSLLWPRWPWRATAKTSCYGLLGPAPQPHTRDVARCVCSSTARPPAALRTEGVPSRRLVLATIVRWENVGHTTSPHESLAASSSPPNRVLADFFGDRRAAAPAGWPSGRPGPALTTLPPETSLPGRTGPGRRPPSRAANHRRRRCDMDRERNIDASDYDLTVSDCMSGSRPHDVAQAGVLPGDYHVHTTFSDGTGSVAACIEQAISVGLTEIGIADHVSAVQPSVWEIPSIPLAELERYVTAVREAASRYDEITVLLGVEADYVPEHETQLRSLLDAWPFDYVIGGVHGVDGFDFDDPSQRQDPRWADPDALFAAYYETVRRAAQFGGFDIIAHLDYIGLWGHTPSPAVGDSIDAALDAIAASGAAVESATPTASATPPASCTPQTNC